MSESEVNQPGFERVKQKMENRVPQDTKLTMDGDDTNPIPHIILNDRSELQGLEAIHSGKTIIVKLEDPEDGSAQMFQTYTTSINNLVEKSNDEETEIAFEIIQEPLLGENGSGVENRLYFDSNFQLERNIHHSKESLQIVSIENGKEEEHLTISPEERQSRLLTDYTVELGDNSACNNSSKDLSANSSPLSSLQNILPPASDNVLKLQELSDDNAQNSDVLKKTTVEAFVKMIVCRKITIQKKNAKTGEILDVDVKTEEEEPVVLDVDYVETTEDSLSGNISKKSNDNVKSASVADRSLHAVNAIAEKSSKISQRLLTNSLLQSALKKKLSKVLQSDKLSLQLNSISETQNTSQTSDDRKSKVDSCSESEWMEDCNDNSADYIPYTNTKYKLGNRARKSHKDDHSSKFNGTAASVPSLIHVKVEKEDSDICIPKKRGRKRKWDRTIGIASNMKTCQFCNKHFDTVSNCNKHMKKGNCVSSYFCFICSKNFDFEHQLDMHISTHRNDNKRSSYDCADCRRSYRTKAGYVKHFRMGTCTKRDNFEDGETGDYRCELCDSRFSTLDYLQLHHYKVHENPKDRHMCPLCGKTFYSLQGFQRHRAGRSCTEPLKCRICGKTYKAKESFKLHMKHHKSEITGITFNCDECGRSYMTEAALTKHKILHTGVKPYKCDVCGKEFAMRYQVKDHSRMHSGEKPFSCSICNVSFSNKGHLGRHLRSHENGTLLRRGRPKKVQDPETSGSSSNDISGEAKIKLGQTIDGQMIQVIDSGQIFASQGNASAPMIIQADTNTIIIATEGWPENAVPVSVSQPVVAVKNETNAISISS